MNRFFKRNVLHFHGELQNDRVHFHVVAALNKVMLVVIVELQIVLYIKHVFHVYYNWYGMTVVSHINCSGKTFISKLCFSYLPVFQHFCSVPIIQSHIKDLGALRFI